MRREFKRCPDARPFDRLAIVRGQCQIFAKLALCSSTTGERPRPSTKQLWAPLDVCHEFRRTAGVWPASGFCRRRRAKGAIRVSTSLGRRPHVRGRQQSRLTLDARRNQGARARDSLRCERSFGAPVPRAEFWCLSQPAIGTVLRSAPGQGPSRADLGRLACGDKRVPNKLDRRELSSRNAPVDNNSSNHTGYPSGESLTWLRLSVCRQYADRESPMVTSGALSALGESGESLQDSIGAGGGMAPAATVLSLFGSNTATTVRGSRSNETRRNGASTRAGRTCIHLTNSIIFAGRPTSRPCE
jgi:hypothetical protein